MNSNSKNIEWFRSIIEEEISTSKSFFIDDISKAKTDKGIKRLKQVYSSEHLSRLIDISKFDDSDISSISNILEIYSSEVMKYFLKRLCEGEMTESGSRQLFELNIMSEDYVLIESLINKNSLSRFDELFGEWLISRFS